MVNIYAYKRMNRQVKEMKQKMEEELIDILKDNGIEEGKITVSDTEVEIIIPQNVETVLFKHIDKYMYDTGKVSIKYNGLSLKYIL